MMNSIVRLQNNITRTVLCHTGIVVLGVLLCFTNYAFGEEADKITTIHVVTPTFLNAAHEDETGLFFDIIRSVYESAGLTMTSEIVPWKRAVTMIQSNRADAMPGVPANVAVLLPTYPIVSIPIVAVFKKETMTTWAGIASLNGKRTIWIRGYDLHKTPYLQDAHVEWQEIDEWAEAWFMLERGTTDVYIEALPDVEDYRKNNHVDMQPYQVEPLWNLKLYMSFADTEKSKTLMDVYDTGIRKLLHSGELHTLFEKWGLPFLPEIWQE